MSRKCGRKKKIDKAVDDGKSGAVWAYVQEILKEDEQKKEQLHEQEVQQEEENRQSSR